MRQTMDRPPQKPQGERHQDRPDDDREAAAIGDDDLDEIEDLDDEEEDLPDEGDED